MSCNETLVKICPICKLQKPLTKFYKMNKDSFSAKCKSCYNSKEKVVYNNHCVHCGKEYKSNKSNSKYCSDSCCTRAYQIRNNIKTIKKYISKKEKKIDKQLLSKKEKKIDKYNKILQQYWCVYIKN